MKIVIILMMSLALFCVIRAITILLYMLIEKKYKVKDDGEKFELILSICFYWIYIFCFLVAAKNVSTIYKLSNLEWYIIYTYIGMISVVWCYFSWRLKWNARPQFAKNEKEMILKKIIVFLGVMILSFAYGYIQLNQKFSSDNTAEDANILLMAIVNITIIPEIIALDRVINQIKLYINSKEKNSAKPCNK